MDYEHCATCIEQASEALADVIVTRHYQHHPALAQRYGVSGRNKCLQDAQYHLTYLAQAIRSNSTSLFNDYIDWALTLLKGLNIADNDLRDHLVVMAEVLREQLPQADAQIAGLFVEQAGARFSAFQPVPSFILDDAPQSALARAYLVELLSGRRHEAGRLILAAVESGTSVADIYLHVFQNSQREVGRLWQSGKISVGQEHFCTAATQMVMSQLYPYIFNVERCGHAMVATCVGGELHEIGVRMVTDFFEMAGWDTYYLGANVPIPSVISSVKDHRAQVLGISATITTHISQVRDLIQALRADSALAEVKVLVGGYPFNIEHGLWRDVGADVFASDAAESIRKVTQLLS